jgi:hypothetical protein
MTTLYVNCGLLVRFDGALGISADCCCPCAEPPPICHFPDEWRVVDGDDVVIAFGPAQLPPAPNDTVVVLQQRPGLFPLFYYSAGLTNYRLQVKDAHVDWVTIAEFSHDLNVCTNRYGEWPAGTWPQPEHWACKVDPETFIPVEPCDPCDQPLDWGSGEPIVTNGVGVTFTGSVDGEWTNLANWADAGNNSPAGSLPGANDDVVISGSLTSHWLPISVADMTIPAGGEVHVSASVENLYCQGLVGRGGACDGEIGNIFVAGACEFDGGSLAGEVSANGSTATFVNASQVSAYGVLYGNADFTESSIEGLGSVTGNAAFSVTGGNLGTVGGDATFDEDTFNGNLSFGGTVDGNAVFRGDSTNVNGSTVAGNAEFEGNATNNGQVLGTGEFADSSENTEIGQVYGFATFFDTSINAGEARSDATFGGSATNTGQVFGNATFSGTSAMESGSVGFDATFSDSAEMQGGDVTGTATFTDDACYVAGTAGTFDPDPPPDC